MGGARKLETKKQKKRPPSHLLLYFVLSAVVFVAFPRCLYWTRRIGRVAYTQRYSHFRYLSLLSFPLTSYY